MSEKKYKENKSIIPLVSTIVIAVIAIVLAIVAMITLKKDKPGNGSDPSQTISNNFVPSNELIEECTYAAHDLVRDNFSVIRLYITEGLAHYDEPYGNLPEDGIYTVNSTEYSSLEQIEEMLKSIYVNSEAERVLTNIDGNGRAVYVNREILVDAVYTDEAESGESRPLYTTETVLGISADFTPDTSYTKDWSTCNIAVLPKSETECELTIYLGGLTPDSEIDETNKDSVLETAMRKIDGEWRLAQFVY
ncbi:MAG: hypothetical protein K2O14_05765 [Oscillospiraceae bacterium]|nr:hypothetical protein [Oscillospiraceae bacterium]